MKFYMRQHQHFQALFLLCCRAFIFLFFVILAFYFSFNTQAAPLKPPKKVDVLIIGAGLSGLATAYHLKKNKISYHILEILPKVGGRVRTVRYETPGVKTFYSDSGMEEYWESNPAVEILKKLKLPIRSDVAISSIVLDKKLYELGDETQEEFYNRIFTQAERDAIQKFKKEAEPIIHDLVHAQKNGLKIKPEYLKLKDISFAEWVKQKNLPNKTAEWVRVSVECEVGTHWDRFSALDGLAEFHIFLGDGEKSFRVNGGNDLFTASFAKAIGTKHISLLHRATRIESKNNHVFVSYLNQENNSHGVIEAKHVVSTIPLFRLFEVQFAPALSQKKREAIQSMTWGAYFKAHFFLKPEAEKLWIKNKSSILPILSDSNLGVIYDGNPDQEGGKIRVISTLVHGDAAEVFNMMNLDQVRKEMLASFEKLWPGFGKYVLNVEFYRYHPRAIAGWPVGRSRFDELSNEIRKPDHHVYLSGDFTETTHSDGAFISAERVVRDIVKKTKKGKK